nr:intraflagellar transport protein 74 homolog [Ciona intestinalis]XP_018667304.1 intraflagellar transport protein 74 homolog [Ciona intestinalis]|eukprot:XP_002128844.1 intraflagellar transport protein 74 homolog [Ciona intestinalis]
MAARPPSSLRGRPPTGSMGRPSSSMRMGPPGTGRPGTRSGQAGGGSSVFGSGIKVQDRPMTQQGLSGMKTASRGQRQIQDRSYWLGEIRAKTTELTSEIHKTETAIVKHQEDNNTFLMFEKRAETLASEIAEIQGELHDYNMMMDRVNMNHDISDMVEDLNALKVRNDRESDSLERIFKDKEAKEKQIESIEKEIRRERTLTENRVQEMGDDMRERYSALKQQSFQTLDKLHELQEMIESLTTKQQVLEMEMQNDAAKMEAVHLYKNLNELNEKREQLEEEDRSRLSPEQEQQQLLASVKSHNQEISVLDRQNRELGERMNILNDDLQQVENELEDQEGEATEKFRLLQKREKSMVDFAANFVGQKEEQVGQHSQLQDSIVVLLEQVSKTIGFGENLPSKRDMKALKNDLEFKEGELQKAEATSSSLMGESSKLHSDLTKVEELEDKINDEKNALNQKMEQMLQELEVYRDIDALRATAEKKKRELGKEREELEKKKGGFRDDLTVLNNELLEKQKILEESETHAQLANLERKWQHLEQNNYALKEYIASNSVNSGAVKHKVTKDVIETNQLLQDIYTKSSLL